MSGYAVRRGPFDKTSIFRLTSTELLQSIEGKPDRAWPLQHLKRVRIVAGSNRYVADETVVLLSFRKGSLAIPSHSFQALGQFADQRKNFIPFVRDLCREAADVTPPIRFEAGRARTAGLFTGAIAILGVGVALLLIAALFEGASGLGVDLAARLAFVLMLMFAIQPWLTGASPRRFDPRSIPPDVLS